MRHLQSRHRAGGAALLVGALGAVAAWAAWRNMAEDRPAYRGDAPRRAWRHGADGGRRESRVVGRAVTINRPRQEVYDAWRDFTRLPVFLQNVVSVELSGEGRSRWSIAGPAGSLYRFETEIVDDRPGEVIAWRSLPGGDVRNSGRICFRDAPGGRGTVVEAEIAYDPPYGDAGRLVAKLMQREPQIQARRDLKRFKQMMETGEIATSAMRAARDS